MLIILSILIIVLGIVAVTTFVISTNKRNVDEAVPMYLRDPNEQMMQSVRIRTVNARFGMAALAAMFIIGTLLFLAIVLVELEIGAVSELAKDAMDYIEDFLMAMIFVPIIPAILAFLLPIYIEVNQGQILVNNRPVTVRSFGINHLFANSRIIYLKTQNKMLMLLPVSDEAMRRYPNRQLLKDQERELRSDVDRLEHYLLGRGIERRKYTIMSKVLLTFGIIFGGFAVAAFGLLIGKYYI